MLAQPCEYAKNHSTYPWNGWMLLSVRCMSTKVLEGKEKKKNCSLWTAWKLIIRAASLLVKHCPLGVPSSNSDKYEAGVPKRRGGVNPSHPELHNFSKWISLILYFLLCKVEIKPCPPLWREVVGKNDKLVTWWLRAGAVVPDTMGSSPCSAIYLLCDFEQLNPCPSVFSSVKWGS